MSNVRTAPGAIGQPVRRMALLRSLRSNIVASMLTVWTVVTMGVTIAVLVQRNGMDRPFRVGAATPAETGVAIAQWWVLTIAAGMLVLAPALTAAMFAGRREQRFTGAWRSTLVGPRRVLTGQWGTALATVLLAGILAVPPAGLALALGGTTAAQLLIGFGGMVLVGAAASAVALAFSCRSKGLVRPLLLTYLVLAAFTIGPFVVHGLHPDPNVAADHTGLAVSPLVGIADAAAPHSSIDLTHATAADAPLTHLRATSESGDRGVPIWAATLIGAGLVTVLALLVGRWRLRRPTAG